MICHAMDCANELPAGGGGEVTWVPGMGLLCLCPHHKNLTPVSKGFMVLDVERIRADHAQAMDEFRRECGLE